ncbi:MAG: DEAD/DEAH box helicase [Planctomycetota bacterium]
MLSSIHSLPGTTVESIRDAARAQHQHFRALGSGAVRSRARVLSASDRLTDADITEEGATVLANDGGSVGRVRLEWRSATAGRCTCSAFARRATCVHVIGLLDAILKELGGSVRPTHPGSESSAEASREAHAAVPPDGDEAWLERLESYRQALEDDRLKTRHRLTVTDAWDRAARAGFEARFILRFVDRRGGSVAQLEAQVRDLKPAEDAIWAQIPFAAAKDSTRKSARTLPRLADLGEAHSRVAAIAAGVPDASWYLESHAREVTLARVERSMAMPLLMAAVDAAPLFYSDGPRVEPVPLALHLDGAAALELYVADESTPIWSIRGRVRLPGGGAIEARDVAAASADGLIVTRPGPGDPAAIAALLDHPRAGKIALDLAEAPLSVPAADAETLSVLSGVARLTGEGLARAARPVEPVPCLRVDAPLRAGRGVRMECYLHFDYAGSRVAFDDPARMIQTLDGRATPRRMRDEEARIERFFELGGRRTPADRRQECDASVPGHLFPGMAATLLDEGWRVVAEDRLLKGPTSVSASIRSGVDWFDLEGGVSFGDEVIPFPTVLDAAAQERGYVTLGDGSRGILPDAWLSRWRLASTGTVQEDDSLRFDESQAWMLSALVEQLNSEVDDPFRKLRMKLAELGRPRALEAPAGFEGSLRPYQREGLGWLALLDEVGLSGCLADDMGLGKTVQLLAYLALRRERHGPDGTGAAGHCLVVAPLSLVYNWLAEAARFTPGIPLIDFTGPSRWKRFEEAQPGSLLVTTYGALRRDALRLRDSEFDVAILDEAQAIKTRTSQTAKAARALRAKRRVALTGTPIENHLGELWSQLEFLNPGMLGAATAFERMGASRGKADLIDEGRELLARALRPFLLRRKKADVLDDLPPKTEQVLRAPLQGAQKSAYAELSKYYRSELSKSKGQRRAEKFEDPNKLDLNVLAALTRLRQCACHPGLVDTALRAERSGKLDLVIPMLVDLTRRGSKAIVFSSYTRHLDRVRTRLETEHVPYQVLDGKTRQRGELVRRFQSATEGTVFLISIKAGGAGLNLTAADYVFLLDPWWNPAVEAQAIDRAHRIGRTQPVHVYRVLTEDTIEARVVDLQAKKSALADEVLSGATSALADLSTDDLAFLLS